MLIDECISGQSFSSITGSDSQFYLDNFDFNLFESGPSSEDYSRGTLSTLSVTESLSSRISALEDSAGIHQFIIWRVPACQVVPVLVSLARELLGLSVTDSDFCIVLRQVSNLVDTLVPWVRLMWFLIQERQVGPPESEEGPS